MNRFPLWPLAATVLFFSSFVAAGPGTDDNELAKKLYEQAAADMDRGAYDRACPQFETALKLNPNHVRTAITLGTCEDRWGKLVSAQQRFEVARRLAMAQSAMEKVAEIDKHLADLNTRLPKLRIIVPETLAGLNGLIVVRNGTQVPASKFGQAIAVDPGTYEITATATGVNPLHVKVQTKPGQTVSVTLTATAESTYEPNDVSEEAPSANRSIARPLGFTGITVGAAGIVVGSILGGLAISKNNASDAGRCDINNYCDSVGTSLRREAQGYANASTALFAIGGAFLVGGIVLVAIAPAPTKPNKTAVDTHIRIGLGSVGLRGQW